MLGGADNLVWWWWWGCCEGGGGGGILGLRGRVRARERELGFWVFEELERDTVNEIERYNVFGKNEKPKKKKTEGRFGERVRRSIVAVQPTTITKKNCCKKESLLWRLYKHCYSSRIVAFFFTTAIVFAQNDVFIAAGF